MEGVGRKGWFERVGLQGGIESRRNRMLSVSKFGRDVFEEGIYSFQFQRLG